MGYKTASMMTPEARKDRFYRAQIREDTKNKQAKDSQERSNAASILLELSLNSSLNEQSEQGVEEEENQPARDLHDPCIEVIMKLKAEKRQLLTEVENLQAELQDTRHQLRAYDLAACGAQLAIPAFTRGKSQLSPKEIEIGRRLSRARIHVERAIERVKNFKILSTTLKINLVPHFDNIMTKIDM
ncbi:uncharacterized protein LOC124266998 [Haliotis rubra]|uniref:uncharacterized protein LOC124266998 n=1 Tax=Haliotis rubra TaxID=36100 RepID=UPI001EE5BD93|nr:uncharacterized protein LOC124266998 [Haliotis rubra]